MAYEVEIQCANDIADLLDNWIDRGVPPHQQTEALIMAVAAFALEQDDPCEAITAVMHSLLHHFYKMSEQAEQE